MKQIYKQEVILSNMHTDRFGRLTPAALLYLVQEAAGAHSRLLGADGDQLGNLFWAVSRTKVEVEQLPRIGQTVTVETWPMPTTRVAYPRAVVARDEADRVCFRAISLWVLMDKRTRQLALPGVSGVVVDGILQGNELSVPRAVPMRPSENSAERTVGFSLLDQNGHMNNTRYMDWVADLLPSSFQETHPVKGFTVCYLSEAREGDKVTLDFDLSEEAVFTVCGHRDGENSDGRIFTAQVQF